jgi:HAD superfamily hydrolase (TIGR01509 family)
MRQFFKNQELTDEAVEKLADEKEALFREIYAEHVSPIPHFLAFLNELKAAGFKTGVATSAPKENLLLIMGILDFESQMESTLSSENVKQHKPHPEVYLTSMKNLGTKPENSLVFEDSASGIMAGKNAGAKVVGVLTTHSKEQLPPCDFYIHDYTEISLKKVLDLLEK